MRVQAYGRNGSSFVVKVVCSEKFGWRVSKCDTRLFAAMNVDVSNKVQAQAGVVTEVVTVISWLISVIVNPAHSWNKQEGQVRRQCRRRFEVKCFLNL